MNTSHLAASDWITDFDPAEGDRIRLDYDNHQVSIELPRGLFNAGVRRSSNLETAIRIAYADRNQWRVGKQALGNASVLPLENIFG